MRILPSSVPSSHSTYCARPCSSESSLRRHCQSSTGDCPFSERHSRLPSLSHQLPKILSLPPTLCTAEPRLRAFDRAHNVSAKSRQPEQSKNNGDGVSLIMCKDGSILPSFPQPHSSPHSLQPPCLLIQTHMSVLTIFCDLLGAALFHRLLLDTSAHLLPKIDSF